MTVESPGMRLFTRQHETTEKRFVMGSAEAAGIAPEAAVQGVIAPLFLTYAESEFPAESDLAKGGFAVKRKRFSVEQIVGILKQAEVGVPVVELCRQAGIAEQTFYRWKKQYVGLEVDQVRQLKQLLDEIARLKRLVAELSLDKTMLQDVLSKKL